jgi:hypothetical protein
VSRVSRETDDSVDGHNAPEPVTLRHVDTGEWRYGQDGDNRPWTESSAGAEPSPDLWSDDGAETWTSTTSWPPRHQADPDRSAPLSPTPIDDGSYGSHDGLHESDNGTYGSSPGGYGARAGAYPSGGYPIRGYSTGYTAPPRYGVVSSTPTSSAGPYGATAFESAPAFEPAPAFRSAPAFGSAPPGGSAPVSGSAPISSAAAGSAMVRRPGLAALTPARRGGGARGRLGRVPEYLKVLWCTAAWYAGALVVYLLWLAIAGGDREAVAGRQFVDALPWVLAAALISGGLATALRRLTVGWGAIGVSFAAAVIGAGLATIIHSFA